MGTRLEMETLRLAASRVYTVYSECLGYIQTMSLTDVVWTEYPKLALPMSKSVADNIVRLLEKNDIAAETVVRDAEQSNDCEDTETRHTQSRNMYCHYCGGTGNAEWFQTHNHPNPFGDH